MRREKDTRAEASPLFNSLLVFLSLKGGGEVLKRGADAPPGHPAWLIQMRGRGREITKNRL